jgi:predicted secreted protein
MLTKQVGRSNWVVGSSEAPLRIRITFLVGYFFTIVFPPAGALAADAAERDLIGFSKDGKWFAFEEFGVQDGSGFPYSTIYLINTYTDQWAPGSPFRIRIDDESSSLKQAREKAFAAAASTLRKYDTFHPGAVLATNSVGEATTDPLSVRFKRHHNIDDLWIVRSEKVKLPRPGDCAEDEEVFGVALEYGRAGSPLREVYRDRKIPSSRGCPIGYQLADVVAYDNADVSRLVILIHVLSRGFEGVDSRFLAIPLGDIEDR